MTNYKGHTDLWLLGYLDNLVSQISEYKEDAARHGGYLPEEIAMHYSECLEAREEVENELDIRGVVYREEYPDDDLQNLDD